MHFFLKPFFPSWRFFEDYTHFPQLSFRVASSGQELGPWQQAISAHGRKWWSIFLNPQGNLELACHTLVERFIDELGKLPDDPTAVESLVTYQLLVRLVRSQILRQETELPAERFQFKISEIDLTADAIASEDLLLSSMHEIEAP